MLLRAEKGGHVFEGNSQLNLARFVAAFILHITIMPEIFTAINLMRFVTNNPKGFYGK